MQLWKRMTSLLLVMVLLVSMFPVGISAEEEHDGHDHEHAVGEASETYVGPVAVEFLCSPENLRLTVTPVGEDTPIDPVEEGKYLLLPGEYTYSAFCEGYVPVEEEPLPVPQTEKILAISVNLEPDQTAEAMADHEHVLDPDQVVNSYYLYHEGVCTICGEVVQEMHYGAWDGYNYDEYNHRLLCDYCNEWNWADHVLDSDGNCTVCPYFDHEHILTYQDGDVNDWGHTLLCSVCRQNIWQGHTMDENEVCTVCGYYEHEHDFVPSEDPPDTFGHNMRCTICRYFGWAGHTFEGNTCTFCGYTIHEHDFVYDNYRSEEGHDLRCTICGAYDFQNHTMDKDGVCTVCGYTIHEHDFVYDNYRSEKGHDLRCTICGAYDFQNHTMDNDGVCTVCGYFEHEHSWIVEDYIVEECHWIQCSICGYTKDEAHRFEGDTCTVCGYVIHEHNYVMEKYFNDEEHWYSCTLCDTNYGEKHTFKDDVCTACGYFKHEHVFQYAADYSVDDDGHTVVCTVCAKTEYRNHTMANGKCTVCGYFNHTHLYNYTGGNGYTSGHSVMCAVCGAYKQERHTPGKNGACTVCGYYGEVHEYVLAENYYYAEAEDFHMMVCIICGGTKLEAHTAGSSCTVCGYKKHTHKLQYDMGEVYHQEHCSECPYYESFMHEMKDGVCSICGYKKHEHKLTYTGSENDYGHMMKCSVCGLYFSNRHTYPDANKLTCTVCGYKAHVHKYSYNGGNRWFEGHVVTCSECNTNICFPHIIGSDTKCAVCGWEKGAADAPAATISITAPKDWLLSGKTMQLKAVSTVTDIAWAVSDADSQYVSVSSTGKVTAKTVTEAVEVTVYAYSKSGAAETASLLLTVYPDAEQVGIRYQGGNVTGQTITVDVNTVHEVTFRGIRAPEIPVANVTWKTSDTKGVNGTFTDNGDGTCTVSDLKLVSGKAAVVTLTATADDGSGASSTVKLALQAAAAEGSLSIVNAPETVIGGKSVTLTAAFAEDTVISDKTVLWSVRSCDAAFASIDAKGKLTTKAVSELTVIEVTAASKQNPEVTASVCVELLPLVQSVSLSNIALNNTLFIEEETVQLIPVILPEDASPNGTWKSSSNKIAEVNADGVVKFLKEGTVTVTFTAGDGSKKSGSIKLIHGTPVSEISITTAQGDVGSTTVLGGQKVTLKATVNADASVKKLSWRSSDPTVTVSASGVVTTKAVSIEKTVVITAAATDGTGLEASFTVVVEPKPTVLPVIRYDGEMPEEITGTTVYAEVGDVLELGTFAAAPTTWTSSNKAVAAVEPVDELNCKITLNKVGTATITVKEGKNSGKITVKVGTLTDGVESIAVKSGASTTLTSGKSKITLVAGFVNPKPTVKTVTWTSSDTSVATVSSKGLVTAKAGILEPRSVTITAAPTDGCAPMDITLTVVPPVTAVSLSAGETSALAPGETLNGRTLKANIETVTEIPLSVKVFPNTASDAVTWKTSSAKIAAVEVEDGQPVLKIKGTGTVTVTATAADGTKKAASFKVNVVRYPVELRDATATHEVLSGKKLTLKVELGVPSGLKPTSSTLVYSISPADAAFASVTSKGVFTAKTVKYPRTVTVTVSFKDDPTVTPIQIPVTIVTTLTPVTNTAVTVWSDGNSSWLTQVQQQFEKAHPEYKITWKNEVHSIYDVLSDWESAAKKPDVFSFPNDTLSSLMSFNAVMPLSGTALTQMQADNGQAAVDSVTGTDGQVYGFPYNVNTWFCYYNKSVFSENDVKSLDAMVKKGVVAFPVKNSWYLGAFFFANGGTAFGPHGNDAAAGVSFGPDNGVASAKAILKLLANPNFVVDENGLGIDGMKDGTVSAYFSGSWEYYGLKQALGDKLGACQLPAVSIDGQQKSLKAFLGSKAVGVNPASANTKIAMEFAAFMTSAQSQKLNFTLNEIIPCALSLRSDADIQKNPVAMAVLNSCANTTVVQPTLPEMGNWWSPMETLGHAFTDGSVTEDNCLDYLLQTVKSISAVRASALTAEMQAALESDLQTRITEILNTSNSIVKSNTFLPGKTYTGTAYYISNDGDDDNDGLSPSTPWRTLGNVLRKASWGDDKFRYGDAIFLKRGDIFRLSDWALSLEVDGLTISAYGEGEKPILTTSSENGAGSEKWQLVSDRNGAKIWQFYRDIKDVGLIVLNGGPSSARRVYEYYDGSQFYSCSYSSWSMEGESAEKGCNVGPVQTPQEALTGNLTFLSRAEVDGVGPLYLRCDSGNPGEVFHSIEFCERSMLGIIWLGAGDNVFDNLSLAYTGTSYIKGQMGKTREVNNTLVQNCEFSYGGGSVSYYFDAPPQVVVQGDGLYNIVRNAVFNNNYFHDSYASAIGFEDDMNETERFSGDFTITNNVMVNTLGVRIGSVSDSLKYLDTVTVSGNQIWNTGGMNSGYFYYAEGGLGITQSYWGSCIVDHNVIFGTVGDHPSNAVVNILYLSDSGLETFTMPQLSNNILVQYANHGLVGNYTLSHELLLVNDAQAAAKYADYYKDYTSEIYVIP